MKKGLLRKPFFLIMLLWLCHIELSRAQTPSSDIDSITEDSYRRMLERQAAEQKLDALNASNSPPLVQEEKFTEWQLWYYMIGVFVISGGLVFLRYRRRISKTKDGLKK